MGVKHFYYWYSRQYRNCIESKKPFPVDILGLDMNGLFHGCAQKIYRYGNFADSVPLNGLSNQSLLRGSNVGHRENKITPMVELKFRRKLFEEIGKRVIDIVRDITPRKCVLLCVDGVAGLGKMNQQRQRRFRTSQEMKKNRGTPNSNSRSNIPPFNPNQFTPGTLLMDQITKYLDSLIRHLQTTDPCWKHLRVVFSNEKAPGEGEHKIMHYIRHHAHPTESVCIYGMDADLVMLAMLLPTKNVLIARETDYYRHEYIVVSDFVDKVMQELNWENGDHPYSDASSPSPSSTDSDPDPASASRRLMRFHPKRAVQDFVLLCFLVGNDFLPTVPALSIMDGGLQLMFNTYRRNGQRFGHLTQLSSTSTTNPTIVFGQRSMGMFLSLLSTFEKDMIERKYNSGAIFHHDPIIIRNSKRKSDGRFDVDMVRARADFYTTKFPPQTTVETICHKYFDGMLWVANYYRSGIPDWLWCFPFLYGPYLSELALSWRTYQHPSFQKHQPVDPFLQLVMVLPPSDQKDLVPSPLQFTDDPSVKSYFPTEIVIDLSGKRKEWEGIVHLPMIPYSLFLSLYNERKSFLTPQDARRNIRGKTFVYTYGASPTSPYMFQSSYHCIPQCRSFVETIVLPH